MTATANEDPRRLAGGGFFSIRRSMAKQPQQAQTPASPFGDLKSIDLEALRPLVDEPPEAKNVGAGLKRDRKLVTRSTVRRLLDLRQVANAAATLGVLPDAGETFHIVCAGSWPAWALVPAMLTLAAPATIEDLHLATLDFAKDNAEQLLGLLDAGLIRRVTLIASCYFKSNESEIVAETHAELAKRGQRMASVRNHAKVIVARFSDGNAITVETSANLRSCKNVEQFAMTNDAALAAFHADWIETVVAGGDER